MTTALDTFTRTLRNLEGMQRRASTLTRNHASSEKTRDMNLRRLRDMVATSDEVCDALDNDPRLAARYNRAERKELGLPV